MAVVAQTRPNNDDPGGNGVRLRPAGRGDADAIRRLEERCFERESERFSLPHVRDLIARGRAVMVVAESDGQALGWSAGLLRRVRGGVTGRVYAVAVDPGAQGQGIGRKLMERLLADLRQRRAGRIYLEVRADNAPAIRLYERFGFRIVKQLTDYYEPGVHGVKMMLAGQSAAVHER